MFVDKYYEMNPGEEDLLPDGSFLVDGMRVLFGDPSLRIDVYEEMSPKDLENARKFNRWCTISYIIQGREEVSFIARYDDGTKKKIMIGGIYPWFVKIDTIPDSHKQTESNAFGQSRIIEDDRIVGMVPVDEISSMERRSNWPLSVERFLP